MVHHWRGLCTLTIPSRCRNNFNHDVSRHPFNRPSVLCLTLPQQPLLGGHSRFNIWASMGPSHPASSFTRAYHRPPASTTQVPCRLPRCVYYRCCDRLLLLELACTRCRWRRTRLGLDTRCIRSGCRPQPPGAGREGRVARCRLFRFTYWWLGRFGCR